MSWKDYHFRKPINIRLPNNVRNEDIESQIFSSIANKQYGNDQSKESNRDAKRPDKNVNTCCAYCTADNVEDVSEPSADDVDASKICEENYDDCERSEIMRNMLDIWKLYIHDHI